MRHWTHSHMKQFLLSLLDVGKVVVIAVVTVVLVRDFLVQPFLVSGLSMAPTFDNGDYLLIDELTYRFRLPERGEVVVFRPPEDPHTFYIKRIIGLPGEALELRDGKVWIINDAHPEGVVLAEPYLSSGLVTAGKTLVLGNSEYFVMGDNRSYSKDSRTWGALPAHNIVGIVRLRLWPIGKAQAFGAPQYNF